VARNSLDGVQVCTVAVQLRNETAAGGMSADTLSRKTSFIHSRSENIISPPDTDWLNPVLSLSENNNLRQILRLLLNLGLRLYFLTGTKIYRQKVEIKAL